MDEPGRHYSMWKKSVTMENDGDHLCLWMRNLWITKVIESYILKGWIAWYVNYIWKKVVKKLEQQDRLAVYHYCEKTF